MLLTLSEREEKVIDKIIAAISDYIQLEPMQIAPVSISVMAISLLHYKTPWECP